MLQSLDDLLGLSANPSKSSLFCAGINPTEKQKLIECLLIREGHLPIRNLGVPLITRKLMVANCGILIDKISGKIDSWLANKFSFAERLQLISAVLYSMCNLFGLESLFCQRRL